MKPFLSVLGFVLAATTFCQAQSPLDARLAIDVIPGTQSSNPNQPFVIGDTMYFAAGSVSYGRELYKFDSVGPAIRVTDVNPGTASALEIGAGMELGLINDKAVFVATAPGTGRELWEYSPATGARLVMDIASGTANSTPLYMRRVGGRVYFTAYSFNYNRLFMYDGINPPVNPASGLVDYPKFFTAYRGKVYMSAYWTGMGEELCVYDSVSNSCSLVKNIKAIGDGSPYGLLTYGGKLYFGAASDSNGAELHSYDGNTVSRLTDINPGVYNGVLSEPIAYKGKLYFAGSTTPSQKASQLWAFDTTTQTASVFMDMYPGGDALPKNFFIFHDRLYFSAADAARGRELWVYDGVNMPMPVTDINPGSGPSHPSDFVVYKDELYFVATNPTTSGFEWYVMRDTTTPAPAAIALTPAHLRCIASPNPVQDVLNISWELARPTTFGVRLADACGRTVWSKASENVSAGSGRTVIPMGELQPGLYFYQLVTADGKMLANGRVLKQY